MTGGTLPLETPDLSPAMRDLLNSDAARQLMRLAADKTATNEQCRRAADNFADELKRRLNNERNNRQSTSTLDKKTRRHC